MKLTTLGALALALAASTLGAAAAETHAVTCYSTGSTSREPAGDREGHELQVSHATCLESGGLLDGAVTTQSLMWEHDKSGSRLLSGDGVARKAGAFAAFRHVEGSRQPLMQDGKQAGWTLSGRGVFTLATGSLASLAGKSFTWVLKRAGPGWTSSETTVQD